MNYDNTQFFGRLSSRTKNSILKLPVSSRRLSSFTGQNDFPENKESIFSLEVKETSDQEDAANLIQNPAENVHVQTPLITTIYKSFPFTSSTSTSNIHEELISNTD